MKRKPESGDYELLIPESVAIHVFNRVMGTNLGTIEEQADWLAAHPEQRIRLELSYADPATDKVQ